MRTRTLYLKKTNRQELAKEWGFEPILYKNDDLYIQCNVKGIVNWSGNLYQAKELVGRNNVKVL